MAKENKCKCDATPGAAERLGRSVAQVIDGLPSADEFARDCVDKICGRTGQQQARCATDAAKAKHAADCEIAYPEIGPPREAIIVALVGLRALGVKLILNTCRVAGAKFVCNKDDDVIRGPLAEFPEHLANDEYPLVRDLLREAVDWCDLRGLVFDAVNKNLPGRVEFYGGDCRKMSADLYIDDNALEAQR